MPQGLLEDRETVLLGLYGHLITADEGPWISPFNLKQRAGLLLSASYIALILDGMEDMDWVIVERDGENEIVYSLSTEGVVKAEGLVNETYRISLDEFEAMFRAERDSGRVVSLSSDDIDAARAELEQLSGALERGNDVGNLSPEERHLALSEVAELRTTLERSSTRITYLWSKSNEVLSWIIKKGAGSMIAELAKSALRHIHQFITVFFN